MLIQYGIQKYLNKNKKTVNKFYMKKLIVFILLILPIFLIFFNRSLDECLFCLENVESAIVVTKDHTEEGLSTLQYNYILVDKNEIDKKMIDVNEEGIILHLSDVSLEKIKKSLNFFEIKTEKLGKKTILYGYTPNYKRSYNLNNKKANVQIVYDNGHAIVGFPSILSGF